MEGLTRKRNDTWDFTEASLMKRILICEREIEKYKGSELPVIPFVFSLSMLKSALLDAGRALDPNLREVFTPEAFDWLHGEAPIGDWCPFWFKWKNSMVWDDDAEGWVYPESDPDRLAALEILADGCDNCMNRCECGGKGRCLCEVRDNIDDLPWWGRLACTRFEADGQEYPDLGGDETLLARTVSENHVRHWEEKGKPVYPKEDAELPMEDAP